MLQQKEKNLSLIFRDEILTEDNDLHEENCLHNIIQPGLKPSIIAAISAALLACGLLSERSVITAIRPAGKASPWKMAGILDLMAGRELIRF